MIHIKQLQKTIFPLILALILQKYSMMMLFCILLIYVVVLSVEVIGSLGAFF